MAQTATATNDGSKDVLAMNQMSGRRSRNNTLRRYCHDKGSEGVDLVRVKSAEKASAVVFVQCHFQAAVWLSSRGIDAWQKALLVDRAFPIQVSQLRHRAECGGEQK